MGRSENTGEIEQMIYTSIEIATVITGLLNCHSWLPKFLYRQWDAALTAAMLSFSIPDHVWSDDEIKPVLQGLFMAKDSKPWQAALVTLGYLLTDPQELDEEVWHDSVPLSEP